MKKLIHGALALLIVTISTPGWSQSPEEDGAKAAEQLGRYREALVQYTAALQKSAEGGADEQRLREAAISVAQKMKPAPGIPEEAKRFSVRGTVAIKEARSQADFEDAAKEFGKATRVAPWWADPYFNRGVAYEKAAKYDEAIRALKLYLLAAPRATDADKVKEQIYALEYRQEKVRREVIAAQQGEQQMRREEQAKAAEEQAKYGHWLGDWRYDASIQWPGMNVQHMGVVTVSKQGDVLEGRLRYTAHYFNGEKQRPDDKPPALNLKGVVARDTGEINWTYLQAFAPGNCYRPDEWRPVSLQLSSDRRAVNYSYSVSSLHHQTCAPTGSAMLSIRLTR